MFIELKNIITGKPDNKEWDYNVITKYIDIGDWDGVFYTIDLLGNLKPEMLSKHRLDYIKNQK